MPKIDNDTDMKHESKMAFATKNGELQSNVKSIL